MIGKRLDRHRGWPRWWPRWWPLLAAALVVVAFGARWQPSRAGAWADAEFQGAGRAHLTITDPTTAATSEVYDRIVYGTDPSTFDQGLLLRSTFPLPGLTGSAVLALDLNRAGDVEAWVVGRPASVRVTYYELDGGSITYDATEVSGELVLDSAVVGTELVGFRVTGTVTVADGTDKRVIALQAETKPLPEDLLDSTYPPLADDPVCEYDCYHDPYYSDDTGTVFGCTDTEEEPVYDEGNGCESGDDGDTYTDDWSDDESEPGCGSSSDDGGGDDGGDDWDDTSSSDDWDDWDDSGSGDYGDDTEGCLAIASGPSGRVPLGAGLLLMVGLWIVSLQRRRRATIAR